MEVFNEQVTPRLGSLERTVRSLYSNGSGGPPGYLEVAREEDNKRFDQLFDYAETAKENGETFKDFIKSYRAERDMRNARLKRYLSFGKWAAPIIGSALLGIGGLIYHATVPVFKVLWEDYLRAHPAVTEKLKTVSETPSSTHSQDAGVPAQP